MSREIYTPIFDGFFEGSIMLEEIPTRWLLLNMIRLGLRPRANGIIDLPVQRLAAIAAMSEDATRIALDALLRPDPLSGSKLEQGRRIVQLRAEQPDRGWRLVNYETYKEMAHNANAAERMRRLREERAGDVPVVPNVPECSERSHDTKRNDTTRNEKKERESASRSSRAPFISPSVEDVSAYAAEKGLTLDAAFFVDHFEAKGWVTGKTPMKDWRAAVRNAAREGWTVKNGRSVAQRVPGPPSRPPGVTFAPDGSWLTFKGERFDREEVFEKRGIKGWYRSAPNAFGEGAGMRLDGSSSQSEAKWTPTEYADFFRRHDVPLTPLASRLVREIGCWPSASGSD